MQEKVISAGQNREMDDGEAVWKPIFALQLKAASVAVDVACSRLCFHGSRPLLAGSHDGEIVPAGFQRLDAVQACNF